VDRLLFRRKEKLKVDTAELEGETASLCDFLRSKLGVDITKSENKLWIDSENLSSKELKRFVNKFVYHRNLMNKYWVELEGTVVTVRKLKRSEKHKKHKEKAIPPSTIKHGW
jgi:hypothetical protein